MVKKTTQHHQMFFTNRAENDQKQVTYFVDFHAFLLMLFAQYFEFLYYAFSASKSPLRQVKSTQIQTKTHEMKNLILLRLKS